MGRVGARADSARGRSRQRAAEGERHGAVACEQGDLIGWMMMQGAGSVEGTVPDVRHGKGSTLDAAPGHPTGPGRVHGFGASSAQDASLQRPWGFPLPPPSWSAAGEYASFHANSSSMQNDQANSDVRSAPFLGPTQQFDHGRRSMDSNGDRSGMLQSSGGLLSFPGRTVDGFVTTPAVSTFAQDGSAPPTNSAVDATVPVGPKHLPHYVSLPFLGQIHSGHAGGAGHFMFVPGMPTQPRLMYDPAESAVLHNTIYEYQRLNQQLRDSLVEAKGEIERLRRQVGFSYQLHLRNARD